MPSNNIKIAVTIMLALDPITDNSKNLSIDSTVMFPMKNSAEINLLLMILLIRKFKIS